VGGATVFPGTIFYTTAYAEVPSVLAQKSVNPNISNNLGTLFLQYVSLR